MNSESRQPLSHHILEVILHILVNQLFYFSLYFMVVSLHWKTHLFELFSARCWHGVFRQSSPSINFLLHHLLEDCLLALDFRVITFRLYR